MKKLPIRFASQIDSAWGIDSNGFSPSLIDSIILWKQGRNHITADIHDFLHWLSVQQKIEYKMCVLVYKCLHQSAPIYLSEFCIQVAASAKRTHLRSAVHSNLIISYCRTKRYGQRSFASSGSARCCSLPCTDSS